MVRVNNQGEAKSQKLLSITALTSLVIAFTEREFEKENRI